MLKTNYTSLPPFQATTRKHLNSIQAYTWFANTNISLQPHLSNLYKIKINYRDGITSFARYQEKNFFEKNLSFCHSVLITCNISTNYRSWQKFIFKLYLSVSVIPGFWHQDRLTIRYSVPFKEWRCIIPSIFFSLRPKEMRLFPTKVAPYFDFNSL